jgi:hypothetical protein
MRHVMQELRNGRPELVRFKDLEDFDDTQGERKRKRTANFDSNEEFYTPSPEKESRKLTRETGKEGDFGKGEGGDGLGNAEGPRTGYDAERRYLGRDKHQTHLDQRPPLQKSHSPWRKDLPQNIRKKASCKYVYSIRVVVE